MSLMNKADQILRNEARKISSKIEFKKREIVKLTAELAEVNARITKY